MACFSGIKKLGKVCNTLAIVTRAYSVMGSWKLGKRQLYADMSPLVNIITFRLDLTQFRDETGLSGLTRNAKM